MRKEAKKNRRVKQRSAKKDKKNGVREKEERWCST